MPETDPLPKLPGLPPERPSADAACAEPVDPYADTARWLTVEPPRAPRRVRRPSAHWLDQPLRFTPPPSRSAVQAHATKPDASGQPLPPRLQSRMERALGGDLSVARVHIQPTQPATEEEPALKAADVLRQLAARR